MSESAVVLMPIEWEEAFGLVAAEAQMVGCPVVAYRRGALPEVVHDGVTGFLVDPGDRAALVEAVRRSVVLDRSAIRSSALARLGVGLMVDDYERTLTSLAG
jgi:glycosyltransferase involved in cell wall biosynthesis